LYSILKSYHVIIVSFGGSFSNTFLEVHHLPASPVNLNTT